MKKIIVLITLFSVGIQYAQVKDTVATGKIQYLPHQDSGSIDIKLLTQQLIDSLHDDFEYMEAIYDYVITNISYDHAAYQGNNRRINRNNQDILRRRKAVCWGYSELIREMCQIAGLPCQTITGYTNTLPFPARTLEYANHAWNAVKLDGKWYLLDATWGSGTQFDKDYFTSAYGVDYYLTPPEWFIKNHFPLMPMWQLLECPITLEDFKSLKFEIGKNCDFNFQDSIQSYALLSALEQNAKALMVAYKINKSATNSRQLGHALVDIAVDKKERGDALMEQDSQALAIEEFEAALDIFEASQVYCDFYPWQNEAYVFTALNLAQACYSTFYQDPNRIKWIAEQFEKAGSVLNHTPINPQLKGHIQSRLNQFLDILN